MHSVGGSLAGSVLFPTYNGGKGQRGKETLVPVPMHIDQSTRRIELSLKRPDLKMAPL
jgi:hypothetical protein